LLVGLLGGDFVSFCGDGGNIKQRFITIYQRDFGCLCVQLYDWIFEFDWFDGWFSSIEARGEVYYYFVAGCRVVGCWELNHWLGWSKENSCYYFDRLTISMSE
jgi:hypothetical protein